MARKLDSAEINLELKEESRIVDALTQLIKGKEIGGIWESVEEMNRESMILHNEVDIGLLDGLDTPLSENDMLTILPLIHGG